MNNIFIYDGEGKLTEDEITDYFNAFISQELPVLEMYHSYYEVANNEITRYWQSRHRRKKTPNNLLPTAYYKTVVDSMSGFMFNNVQYNPQSDADKSYAETLNTILGNNNQDVKDMTTGINSLYCNKGAELVYTIGDISNTEIKYAVLDPREVILIYDNKIEPSVYCAIRYKKVTVKDETKYILDVIYADEWQYYELDEGMSNLRVVSESRQLFFQECPVIVYRAGMIGDKSPFHQIIKYIDALDYLITGNSNEIEKLVDALLVLGMTLSEEQLEKMDEWKVLQDMRQEDRAEYLTKDMSPEFREYVSKLLIQEIHKHSHVIDWYSPDSGMTGQVSAKALSTRLFDMNMYSNRIEKIYKDGIEKRIRLITHLMKAKGLGDGVVDIVLNRTLPKDIAEKAMELKDVTFLSDETKVELCGLDWEQELERLESQNERNGFEPEDEPEDETVEVSDDVE